MKGLTTLIKIQKRELDKLRLQMTQLETKRDTQIAYMRKLKEELEHELEAASQMTEMRGFFGDFSEAIKKKQKATVTVILKLEQQMEQLAVHIQNTFSELKKYEISYENYLAEQKREREKREQIELDELGIQMYQRRQQNQKPTTT